MLRQSDAGVVLLVRNRRAAFAVVDVFVQVPPLDPGRAAQYGDAAFVEVAADRPATGEPARPLEAILILGIGIRNIHDTADWVDDHVEDDRAHSAVIAALHRPGWVGHGVD